MSILFDKEKNKEKIEELEKYIKENKNRPGALMPIMQETQRIFGYLPREMMELISKRLNIAMSEIYGVATFYSQFTFSPMGENIISVCLGTACYVKGAEDILEELENQLGIKKGETTKDLKFSIVDARCLGDCSLAPVITVNNKIYGNVRKKDIKNILNEYR